VQFLCFKNKKNIENNLRLLKYSKNIELAGTFTSKEQKQGEPTKKGEKKRGNFDCCW
jgi:hypothetical protein